MRNTTGAPAESQRRGMVRLPAAGACSSPARRGWACGPRRCGGRRSGKAPGRAAGNPDRIAVMPLEIVGDVPGRPTGAGGRGPARAHGGGRPHDAGRPRPRPACVAGSTRLPCDTADCWTAVGQAVEARYLRHGQGGAQGEPVRRWSSRLIDARPGRLLARETNGCEADDCSVAELCRLVVRELARQTLSRARDERRLSAPLPADPVA